MNDHVVVGRRRSLWRLDMAVMCATRGQATRSAGGAGGTGRSDYSRRSDFDTAMDMQEQGKTGGGLDQERLESQCVVCRAHAASTRLQPSVCSQDSSGNGSSGSEQAVRTHQHDGNEVFETQAAGDHRRRWRQQQYRARAWKAEIQEFADETGLVVHVAHFPPGTSKWNKIEHRLFCHITVSWRGKPLRTFETVVQLHRPRHHGQGPACKGEDRQAEVPKGRDHNRRTDGGARPSVQGELRTVRRRGQRRDHRRRSAAVAATRSGQSPCPRSTAGGAVWFRRTPLALQGRFVARPTTAGCGGRCRGARSRSDRSWRGPGRGCGRGHRGSRGAPRRWPR